MENVNNVTVAGHLVKSAEVRYTSIGKAVALLHYLHFPSMPPGV